MVKKDWETDPLIDARNVFPFCFYVYVTESTAGRSDSPFSALQMEEIELCYAVSFAHTTDDDLCPTADIYINIVKMRLFVWRVLYWQVSIILSLSTGGRRSTCR